MTEALALDSETTPKAFRTILACTDFTSLGQAAVESAIALGRGFHAEQIHVANVVPLHSERLLESMTPEASNEIAIGDRNLAVKILESLDLPASDAVITREVRVGEPTTTLALLAGEIGADLIVLGSHGRGVLSRMMLGSIAQELVRIAPCPVLIIRDETRRVVRFDTIVAGLDLSDLSPAVLSTAIAAAKPFKASVQAVSVFESDYPLQYGVAYGRRTSADKIEREKASALEAFVERATTDGIRVSSHPVPDELPWHGLLDHAANAKASLIVIGSNGRSMIERLLLGSTATKMVEKSEIPLLVVPRGAV
jgi:nucleotide-binding universal stress UspA family protein